MAPIARSVSALLRQIRELHLDAVTGRDQRLEHSGVAGHVDRADAGAGRGERPHVLAAEPAERTGDNRHLAIEAEHIGEDSISHLVIFQLFNWKRFARQATWARDTARAPWMGPPARPVTRSHVTRACPPKRDSAEAGRVQGLNAIIHIPVHEMNGEGAQRAALVQTVNTKLSEFG